MHSILVLIVTFALHPQDARLLCGPASQASRPSSVHDSDTETTPETSHTSVELEFGGAGELDLHGTLTMPAGPRQEGASEAGVPGLVLLPGSGPTDRDGNQKPYLTTDLLKQVAASLAQAGVATLRFDKRASRPYHERLMAMSVEEQNEFFAWDMFVGDAQAALAALRARPEIDAARCGILGHSEGGLIALEAARRLKDDQPPAALVLAATPGTDMAAVLRFQLPKVLAPYGKKRSAELMVELDRIMEHIVEKRAVPNPIPIQLGAFFPPNCADLLAAELALDPPALAPFVNCPVLLLYAEHDIQVPPDMHLELLQDAFEARAEGACEAVVVPSASHNFKRVDSPKEPGFAGPVDDACLSALRSWLRVQLALD